MSTDVLDLKKALRARIRASLKELSAAERAAASVQACARLPQQEIWQSARSILFYAPLPDELDIRPLWDAALAQFKIVALPRYANETGAYVACCVGALYASLVPGRFGIMEPKDDALIFPLNQLDLVLAPGVGFDLTGRRLGRGKGFYDRLLREVTGTKCGIGFDQQVVKEIPVEVHDIHLNCMLTPTRWLSFDQSAVLK